MNVQQLDLLTTSVADGIIIAGRADHGGELFEPVQDPARLRPALLARRTNIRGHRNGGDRGRLF